MRVHRARSVERGSGAGKDLRVEFEIEGNDVDETALGGEVEYGFATSILGDLASFVLLLEEKPGEEVVSAVFGRFVEGTGAGGGLEVADIVELGREALHVRQRARLERIPKSAVEHETKKQIPFPPLFLSPFRARSLRRPLPSALCSTLQRESRTMTYSQFPPPQMQSSNPYDQNQANYQPQYANQQQQYGNQHQQQQQYGHQQKFNSQQPEKFTQPEQTTTKPKYVLPLHSALFADSHARWNDLIFALLFLAQLGAFIAVAVISLRGLNLSTTANRLGSSGGNSITLNTSTAYLLSIIAAVGFVLSSKFISTTCATTALISSPVFLLILVRLFTTVILEVTLFLSVILAIAYAVYLYSTWVSLLPDDFELTIILPVEKSYAAAVLATVFAVFAIVAYFPMRRRIPFSKALLLFVLRIASTPSLFSVV